MFLVSSSQTSSKEGNHMSSLHSESQSSWWKLILTGFLAFALGIAAVLLPMGENHVFAYLGCDFWRSQTFVRKAMTAGRCLAS